MDEPSGSTKREAFWNEPRSGDAGRRSEAEAPRRGEAAKQPNQSLPLIPERLPLRMIASWVWIDPCIGQVGGRSLLWWTEDFLENRMFGISPCVIEVGVHFERVVDFADFFIIYQFCALHFLQ